MLLVPSGVSAVWFAVMGGSALRAQATGARDLVADVGAGTEQPLFGLLDELPLATLSSVLAIVLIGLYFVTSADSASLVLGSLTSRGALRPHRVLVVLWGVLIGAVAAVLLLVGGLDALQQATTLVALPFVVVMLRPGRRPGPGPGPGPRRSTRRRSGPPLRARRRRAGRPVVRRGGPATGTALPAPPALNRRAPRSPGCPPMPPAGRA